MNINDLSSQMIMTMITTHDHIVFCHVTQMSKKGQVLPLNKVCFYLLYSNGCMVIIGVLKKKPCGL